MARRETVALKQANLVRTASRKRILLLATIAAVWAALAGLPADPRPDERWAFVVDQLSLTAPNPDFVSDAQRTFQDAGYGVDYVAGEGVTVEFYRSLLRRRYDVVVFRVHAGRLRLKGDEDVREDAGLFTSERYVRTGYPEEQLDRRLFIARYLDEGSPSYFGISPDFVRKSMQGDFDGATIILMGCDGLRGSALAEAFKDRGAGVVIGWDELVTDQRTDAATERLLTYLVRDGLSPTEAVDAVMREIGPDFEHGSRLMVFASDPSTN